MMSTNPEGQGSEGSLPVAGGFPANIVLLLSAWISPGHNYKKQTHLTWANDSRRIAPVLY